MFVAVVIATLLTKGLVGRTDGSSGLVIEKWAQLLDMVGQDVGD